MRNVEGGSEVLDPRLLPLTPIHDPLAGVCQHCLSSLPLPCAAGACKHCLTPLPLPCAAGACKHCLNPQLKKPCIEARKRMEVLREQQGPQGLAATAPSGRSSGRKRRRGQAAAQGGAEDGEGEAREGGSGAAVVVEALPRKGPRGVEIIGCRVKVREGSRVRGEEGGVRGRGEGDSLVWWHCPCWKGGEEGWGGVDGVG